MTELVVFDFDGTLTTEDTFVGFMKFYMGPVRWRARMARLIPTFLAYKLGRIDRHAVKDAVVAAVFTGEAKADITSQADMYARDIIPTLMRPEGLARFREHAEAMRAGGPTLVVCSASISPYLRAYFGGFPDVDIIACELAYDAAGACTGKLAAYNVWGENKVRALRDHFAPESFQILAAYGDTEGDVPMLNMAQVPFYRPFRGAGETPPAPVSPWGKD